MKKITYLLSFLFLYASLTGCSSDSSSDPVGTLFVNGNNFPIGTNGALGIPNTSFFHQATSSTDLNSRSFNIANGTFNGQNITVIVNYPPTASTINGTYIVNEPNQATATSYATASYTDIALPATSFGGASAFASGSVTIMDNGSNNFTVTFNNVVLKDNANPAITRTITGYAQATFMVL
jgi:hypothetical protein